MRTLLLFLLTTVSVFAQAPAPEIERLAERLSRADAIGRRADEASWFRRAATYEEQRGALADLAGGFPGIDEAALDDDRWIDLQILRAMVEYRLVDLGFDLAEPTFLLPSAKEVGDSLGGSESRVVDLYAGLAELPSRLLDAAAGSAPRAGPGAVAAVGRLAEGRALLASRGPKAEAMLAAFGDRPEGARIGADLALDLYRRELEGRLPRSVPDAPGVGRERFEARLRLWHRIDLPLDEIVATAEREMERVEGLLAETAASIEPGKSWRDITEEMKSSGPGPDELVDFCRHTKEEAVELIREKRFVPLPDYATNCGVKGHDTKGHYPYAYYQPARGENLRGEFVVTTVGDWMTEAQRLQKTRDSNRHWMRVVTVHEALPGHHLQFAMAARASNAIRGRYYTPFFSEGWGLYCEELMWEHGFMPDPRTRIAQLRMRLWRCARVLCDVGIHTRTMTPEQAIGLLVDRCLLEPDNAKKEVDRYLGSPTQPMSYLIGCLTFERMRREYRRLHGDRPDWELEFHTKLLSYGSVPLPAIERVVLGRSG